MNATDRQRERERETVSKYFKGKGYPLCVVAIKLNKKKENEIGRILNNFLISLLFL